MRVLAKHWERLDHVIIFNEVAVQPPELVRWWSCPKLAGGCAIGMNAEQSNDLL
jgi:hypothetical protein